MKKVSIKNIQKKKKGFTLVELIIVIAIIAILAAMAIPKFSAVRIQGKVSNDVAAAKNIQTTTAMLIASGNATYKAGAADKDIKVVAGDDVASKLDGKFGQTAKSEGTNEDFTITIKSNEDIVVKAGVDELYPDVSGAGKTAYLARAK